MTGSASTVSGTLAQTEPKTFGPVVAPNWFMAITRTETYMFSWFAGSFNSGRVVVPRRLKPHVASIGWMLSAMHSTHWYVKAVGLFCHVPGVAVIVAASLDTESVGGSTGT